MALLEYGAAGLAVVTTRVGECEKVISTFGKTVDSNDSQALAEALIYYVEKRKERKSDALKFQKHILQNYSQKAIVPSLIEIYKN